MRWGKRDDEEDIRCCCSSCLAIWNGLHNPSGPGNTDTAAEANSFAGGGSDAKRKSRAAAGLDSAADIGPRAIDDADPVGFAFAFSLPQSVTFPIADAVR